MTLAPFFVGGRFVVLDATASGGDLRGRCQAALAALPAGGGLAIAVGLNGGGRLRRLIGSLTLPFRMARAENTLAGCGATGVQRYGVYPDLHSPTVVFPLRTPAAWYAEEHLVPGPCSPLAGMIRKIFRRCLGFDPSLGAVIVVGSKA